MALIVLDASVVIGFLDAHDAHHSAAVEAIGNIRGQALILPPARMRKRWSIPGGPGPMRARLI